MKDTYDRRPELLEGQKHPAVSPEVDPLTPPEWFEPDSFAHALRVYERYQIVIGITNLYGFTMSIAFGPPLLFPLLATGHSRTLPDLFPRYLDTITHVRKWYTADPFDPKSVSHRSLKMVRGMHQKVAERLNREAPQEGGILWMNQHTMAMVQLSFIVLWALFPEKFGFHNFTPKDKHALFHFWRTMGHCLAIHDRFNICTGSEAQVERLCHDIWYEDWLPRMRQATRPHPMSEGVFIALTEAIPRLNYRPMMAYAAPRIGLDPKPFALRSIREWISYFAFWTIFQVVTRIPWLHRFLADRGEENVARARRERTERKRHLMAKYPNVIYDEPGCPFRIPEST